MADENNIPSNVSLGSDYLKELSLNVGKRALWMPRVWGKNKVKVEVMIVGVDLSFGGTYTIKPMAGSGTTQVRISADGLEILP